MSKWILAALTCIALVAGTGTAQAATIVGQAPPATTGLPGTGADPLDNSQTTCHSDTDYFQLGVNSAVAGSVSYTVPTAGVLTEWRTFGDTFEPGKAAALRVYRVDGANVTALFDSGLQLITSGLVNKFSTRVTVAAGQIIGLRSGPDIFGQCRYITVDLNDTGGSRTPAGNVGTSSAFTPDGALGGYRVDVAAVLEADADNDGFGDETQDQCPADPARQAPPCASGGSGGKTGPTETLGKTPKKKTHSPSASFNFTSDDPAATFQCKLDKKPFGACTSPKKYKKLKPRKHTFSLQGTDSSGNVGALVKFSWRVLD